MTTAEMLAALEDVANGNGYKLALVREELEKRLRMESAKSVGAAGIVKILDRITQNPNNRSRPALMGAWIDEAGMQTVTDGYRAFRLYKPLPLVELDLNKVKPINLASVWIPEPVYLGPDYYPVNAADFDRAALKAAIKVAKAEKKNPLVKIGEAYFNAHYLIDLLDVLPDATIYIPYNPIKAMQAISETGQALILPVRIWGELSFGQKVVAEYPVNGNSEKTA